MLRHYHTYKQAGVLGLNARNGNYILPFNDRRYYPLVDDKVLCKKCLMEHALPVPPLIGVIRSLREATHAEDVLKEYKEFVIKPARGSGGDGILVITDRKSDYFVDSDGDLVEDSDLKHHIMNVIGGMYSLGGLPDVAMVESLVHFDQSFKALTYHGVPDIRVIVYKGYPVMAMSRLPTRRSHGKANLHQGAIGVGIDLASGLTVGGVSGNAPVSHHPDTGESIQGFRVPHWCRILKMASRCYEAVHLGYLGVDIVLDRDHGPLILELNARPGLNIQIANRRGLRDRLKQVEKIETPHATHEQRVEWSCRAFGEPNRDLIPQTPW